MCVYTKVNKSKLGEKSKKIKNKKKEKSRCNWRGPAAAVCVKLLVAKQTIVKRPMVDSLEDKDSESGS